MIFKRPSKYTGKTPKSILNIGAKVGHNGAGGEKRWGYSYRCPTSHL